MTAAAIPTTWSYSKWSDFATCQWRYYLKHVARAPDPGSPALERGIAIHDGMQAYLERRQASTPLVLSDALATEYKGLRRKWASTKCEMELAVDSKWRPCGWKAEGTWLRAKLDVLHVTKDDGSKQTPQVALIGDHKTGREYQDKAVEQQELYAVVTFSHYPELREAHTKMWYLDQGYASAPCVFTPEQVPELRKKWSARAKSMLGAKRFKPSPGQACGWCPFSKFKGGPCEHAAR